MAKAETEAEKKAAKPGRAAKARSKAETRKEKVLHTRISEGLAEDITRVADELRVPASNLVRNVLEDAFNVAETVTENVGDLLEHVLGEADRTAQTLARRVKRARQATRGKRSRREERDGPRPEFPDVLGWQPLILNHAQNCADCGSEIARGENAVIAMTAAGLSQVYLCNPCLHDRP